MRMSTQDYSTLAWVKGALDEVITDARKSLEEFVEQGADAMVMEGCADKLHQVYGTLQILELYGPALLAEEMEASARAFANGALGRSPEVAEPLMRGMIQLPDYLEKLQGGEPDVPLVFLPLLNDLRSSRNAPLMTPSVLFQPNLEGCALPGYVTGAPNPSLPDLAGKLRPEFHKGLLAWYRDIGSDDALSRLGRVFSTLSSQARVASTYLVFRPAQAIVQALRIGAIEPGVAVKQLIGRLDRELKRLAEEGEAGQGIEGGAPVSRDLLYYVASSDTDDPLVQQVKDEFRLAAALPSGEQLHEIEARMAAPSLAMFKTVQEAIKADLVTVKDKLDLYIRGARDDVDAVYALEEPIRKIADTLAMIGQAVLRQRLVQEADRIREFADGAGEPDERSLMEMASGLLFVESSLANLSKRRGAVVAPGGGIDLPDGELSSLVDLTMREAKIDIARAKEAITSFSKSSEPSEAMDDVPRRFHGIAGALRILKLDVVADVVHQIGSFVESRILADEARPELGVLNHLADSITSVEYYIEALLEGRSESAKERILGVARKAVSSLLAAPRSGQVLSGEEATAADAGGSPGDQGRAVFDEVGPEILEIFIDEARQELDVITTMVQRWQSDVADQEALLTFRRSFHTLKGSGRLVGATLIGEFAWAIENMLNRVIDGTLAPGPEVFDVLGRAAEALPVLIDGLEAGQAPEVSVQEIMEKAFDLASSEATAVYRPAVARAPVAEPGRAEEIPPPVSVEEDVRQPEREKEPEAAPTSPFAPVEGIDEEILEVFMEEAEEELGSITENFPRWRANPADSAALGSFRRSFHTLKGSGRMVGATAIGEFSWAAENLLNRVIDGSVPPTSDLFALFEGIIEVLPGLLESLKTGRPPAFDVQPLADQAFALARGEPIEMPVIPTALVGEEPEEEVGEVAAAGPEEPGLAEVESEPLPVPRFDVDPVLLEIFETETAGHLGTLKEFVRNSRKGRASCELNEAVSRAFHTLHGSSHLVGVEPMAAVAAVMERYVTGLMRTVPIVSAEVVERIALSREILIGMLQTLRDSSSEFPASDDFIAQISHCIEDEVVLPVAPVPQEAPEEIEEGELAAPVEAPDMPLEAELPVPEEGGVADDLSVIAAEAPAMPEMEQPSEEPKEEAPLPRVEETEFALEGEYFEVGGDQELVELFLEEASDLMESLEVSLRLWQADPENSEPVNDMARALHTLKGGARLVGIPPLADLGHALESLVTAVLNGDVRADHTVLGTVKDAIDGLSSRIGEVGRSNRVQSSAALIESLEAARGGAAEPAVRPPALEEPEEEAPTGAPLEAEEAPREAAPPHMDLSLEEGSAVAEIGASEEEETLAPPESALPPSAEEPAEAIAEEAPETVPQEEVLPLEGEYFEVGGDREMVDVFLEEGGDLIETLDSSMRAWRDEPTSSEPLKEMQRALHTLKGGARLAGIPPVGDLGHAVESLLIGVVNGELDADESLIGLVQEAVDALSAQLEEVGRSARVRGMAEMIDTLEGVRIEAASRPKTVVPVAEEESEYFPVTGDPDLVQVFLDEAGDLVNTLDGQVSAWKKMPLDQDVLANLQRVLHTLKGGARLAGIAPVGDLSHAFESLLIGVGSGVVQPRRDVLDVVQDVTDFLAAQVEEVSRANRSRDAHHLIRALDEVRSQAREAAPDERPTPIPRTAPVAPAPGTVEPMELGVRPKQEQIRVAAQLLDRLVNNAGEVSIYRARLEQQNSAVGFNVSELDQTLLRLRNQLRQLEIETEAQILYRWEREKDFEDAHSDFDPLEMDRFSTMQQLSRSLMETVNDLANIKDSLLDLQRVTDTLLLQQSRVSTDLQDGLLRTRMVPFSQVVPRLHRLVRQTAKSLGKQAELHVFGSDQELDRNILERMVAPLEHILRNAVAHGIEPAGERVATGKSPTGRIAIYLGREGTNVVLNVADDGAGVALKKVRKRAIERGLLAPKAQIDDDDIIQFILAPGFSTATEVSQIAGRGVGMDVVSSELKQLGGLLEIESQEGQGTNFVIRLPLTLAISEALLAEVGGEIYAIPYPSIEGVVRVARAELEDYYRDDAKLLSYAGHEYTVRYLGGILGVGAVSFPEGRKWFPMLLVRSGEHRVALQVDGLIGNRQIVVKPVGRQLSSIRWITGGTILADGRVTLIIDVTALVRSEAIKPLAPVEVAEEKEEEQALTVMIVDDSITVRKVTSRLLARHNMSVLTAKDGMDAVSMLQDKIPDVMLLDIEMPRMDGFELARHMRNSPDLKEIPIVMITSRTGEKHRDRAMELGVKRYLGKPYQESELLETIESVLAEKQT